GLVNAEKESAVLSGNLSRDKGENVGSYLINQGTLIANGNYTMTFAASNLTITPAPLTVTADAQSKVYGSVDPTLTYKVSGLVNAEKESDVLSGSLTRDKGENVGLYIINQGTLIANGNYTLDFKTNNLEIIPASLTVTADAQSKVYGSVDPTLTYKVTGLVNAEKESAVLSGNLSRDKGENVGLYIINQGSLKASSNYTLDFKTNNLEITQATLTVTADAQSKVYGSVDPALTYKVTGLVNAEKESDVLSGSLTRDKGENVGTYLINQGTLIANGNYTLDFKTNNLEITPASLTVTADAQSKVYGSVDPTLTYKVTGLVNAEKESAVLSGNLSRDKGENVGLYIINQGTLIANGNYTMTFAASNLTITQANLTVTADAQSKVYGSVDPTFTYKVTGLVNAEKESAVLSGNLSRDKGENVGLYIINQGSLKASSNYTLDFKTNNLEIIEATLTVTADAQSKVYGSTDPILTYKVSGLVNAEKESAVLSGSLTRIAGESVGNYDILKGSLNVNSNYSLTFNKAELTITKASITGVKLEDASYVYDGQEKELVVNGNLPKDATVSYVTNKQTEAGVYEVTALVTAPNYIDLPLKAKLTISKSRITGVKLEDASYVYDGHEKELLISGNLPKDATVSYVTNKQTEAGVYEVTALVTAPNYIDLPLKAKLTITKAAIMGVKLEDASYVYDGHEKALLISGNLPKDAKVSYVSNKQTEAGVYEVTALVTAPNYIDLLLKAKLTISKAKQEITFNKLTPIVFDKNIQLQLTASSNSGLPVSYTYSYEGSKAAAIVSPSGTVTVVSQGRIVITVHQVGNNNYAPAKSISQALVIINDEALITDWKINGQRQGALSSTGVFRQECNEITDQMDVELETSVGAEVSTGSKFSISTPKAGIYRQEVVVTSQSGSTTKKYEIVIERPFGFDDIVIQKFDNTLLVNNNPQTNGGYRFIGYRWYKNDQLIGTEQVYSVGNKKEDLLDINALYRVELVTDKGEVLHSCASTIRYTHTKNIQLYPNPVVKNGVLEVAIDYPSTALDQMSASVYSLTGQFLFTVPLQGAVSKVNLPSNMVEGVYIMLIKIEGKTKTFRFMVKP
ncbi:T9SS type A sorting domain-containing protein, partial [Myroides marinus]|uniref:MBG domain-containing protein n=1 Tax=Myroides marinus TaxID=703342 RepID=UPI00257669C9